MYNKKEMKRLDTVMSRADEDDNDSSDSGNERKVKPSFPPPKPQPNKSSFNLKPMLVKQTGKASPNKTRSSAIDFRQKRMSINSDFSESNEDGSSNIGVKAKKIRSSMKNGRKASVRSSIFSLRNPTVEKSHQFQKIQELIHDDETNYPEHDQDEEEKKKEDQRLEKEFEEVKASSLDSTELLYVQFKNPFERMNAYSDSYPLLFLRKYIYFIIKFSSWTSFKIIKNPIFETVSLLVIMWNSLMMATQNDDYELVFTYLYTVEMSLKILGMGFVLNKGAYLREAWNILDFIIVVSSLIPLVFESSSVNISVLRSFRVLRPLKTISSIKNLKVLLNTLFSALPMLLETLMILFFFFMVFAIGGLQLYMGLLKKRCFDVETGIPELKDNKEIVCGYYDCPTSSTKTFVCGKMLQNPNWGITNFDNIFYSLLSVFQCVTLEGWYEIFFYVARAFHVATVLYFVVLVFVGAFFLLNLTLAVIKLKFTQSQNTKEVTELVAVDKVEEIELNELKTFKKGERSFYRKKFKFLLKKFDDYGANPNFNAINNSPMLEFFDNILLISRRKSRRSTVVKNAVGKSSFKVVKEKKLNIPKVESNKSSEKKSFNIRGITFKGFTDLPVIDEAIELDSPSKRNFDNRSRSSKRSSAPANEEDILLEEIEDLMEKEPTKSKKQISNEIRKNKESIISLKSKSPKNQSKKVATDETLALLDELEETNSKEGRSLARRSTQFLNRRASRLDSCPEVKAETSKPRERRFSVADSHKLGSLQKSDSKTFTRKNSTGTLDPNNFSEALLTLKLNENLREKEMEMKREDTSNEQKEKEPYENNTPLDSERRHLIDNEKTERLADIPLNANNGERRASTIKKIFDTIFGKPIEPGENSQGQTPNAGLRRNSISTMFKRVVKSNISEEEISKPTKLQIITKKMMLMHQETKKNLDDQIPSPSSNSKSIVPPDFFKRTNFKSRISLKEITRRIAQVYSIRDFKFGVLHQMDFQPSSFNDVLDLLLKRRLQMEQEAIAERIRNMRYKFSYLYLQNEAEEDEEEIPQKKQKKKRKKKEYMKGKKQAPKRSMTENSFKRSNTNKSTTSTKSNLLSSDPKEFKLPLCPSNPFRIEMLKSSTKRSRVVPTDDMNSSQFTPAELESPSIKTKKKPKVKKEDVPLDDYEKLKEKVNEDLEAFTEKDEEEDERDTDQNDEEDEEKEKRTDNKTIYRLVREKDLAQGNVGFHNFSGQETMEDSKESMGNYHFNKMVGSMASASQDKVVWVPGRAGMLIVLHKHLYNFVVGPTFNATMNLCVFANTIILAMEGLYSDKETARLMKNFNFTFTIIFAIEMGIKLIALTPRGYVKEKMNIFDAFVVIISIFELVFLSDSASVSALRGVRILRVFRVLRVTRLLRSLAFMQIIINVISKSISDFIYIALLLILFIFIYSLLGMQMYAGYFKFGRDPPTRVTFDDFNSAFLTVFQLLTVENWQQILFACLRTSVGAVPGFLYLITWIFIGNMVFLNLFLTILLEGFTNEHEEEPDPLEEATEEPEIVYFIQDSLKIYQKEKKYQNFDLKLALTEHINDYEHLLADDGKKRVVKDPFEDIDCEESLWIFPRNKFRRFIASVVRSPNFENVILTAIVLSSLKLAVDTYLDPNDVETQSVSDKIDLTFTIFFACEAVSKIIVYGFIMDSGAYLKESWNVLDFFIVCSSLLDLALENIDIPVIKILRLLRTLRPLRFISHNLHLKIVVTALLESLSGIFNVAIVVLLVWLMFGILGISLLEKNMFYCKVPDVSPYNIARSQCAKFSANATVNSTTPHFNGTHYNGTWTTTDPNFSNIFQALVSLFILSTQEGWIDIMFLVIDSDGDPGPKPNANPLFAYFIITFILVGTFFLMNLFVGVIFFNFMKAQASEQKSLFLTPDQQHWVDLLRKMPKAKNDFSQIRLPSEKHRLFLYKLLNHPIFDTSIMICIVLNIITMAMDFEGASQEYNTTLENINYFFTAVFILEALLKIIAYGIRGYWYSGWNRFDAFVVLTSIVDIMMSQAGQGFLNFMKSGTQLARIFRVLRVTRLLKLIKSLEGLQKIIETLLVTLPSLMNVGALLFLIFFIYSVLGVYLFRSVTEGDTINELNNFSNFGNALIVLFRCSTGEDWFKVMFDLFKLPPSCVEGKTCGSMFTPVYFLTFILICTFIMLNLFILIIIQQFEERASSRTDMVEDYKEYLDSFRKVWSVYSVNTKGVKVHQKYLIEIFKCLKPPFGFELTQPKHEIAKEIMLMNLSGDSDGYVYFNEVLLAAMKRVFIDIISMDSKPDVMEVLSKAEIKARRKIEKRKQRFMVKDKKSYARFATSFKETQKQKTMMVQTKTAVNPIFDMLYLGMVFKAFQKFSNQVQECLEFDPEYRYRILSDDYQTDSEESLDSDEFISESSENEDEMLEEEEESDDDSLSKMTSNSRLIGISDSRLGEDSHKDFSDIRLKLKSEENVDHITSKKIPSSISKFKEEP